jgi:putative phosphoribosyl transferase
MHNVQVEIPAGSVRLKGVLTIPASATGIVIFSHGSGSSYLSPRNNKVASALQRSGLATLLCNMLSEEEDESVSARFDIGLLTERLHAIVEWQVTHRDHSHLLPVLFGASTGAASALRLAARLDGIIRAVVSRGGRPDLAADQLSKVTCPTLLIVGELDFEVLKLNRQAYEVLNCKKQLAVVPGASHLFEEPGKLDEVAALATNWFLKNLPKKQFQPKTGVAQS